MNEEEVPLVGGNTTEGLVRVGSTVRRPSGPWSASVHHFLSHLNDVDYEAAPGSLGFDVRGRHVLEYVEGRVSMPFQVADLDAAVRRVGRLLRDLHDASAEYAPPDGAVWNVVIPPDRYDLVVHHDAAPWNLVLGTDRWTFIDWDTAAPGSRLWDLSYAAHGFIPLAPDTAPGTAARLLASLADGYRLSGDQRLELAELLAPRIWSMYTLLEQGHNETVEWASLWSKGHGEVWRTDAEYAEEHHHLFLSALLGDT
jgi:Ser/Thr protein kinase RdoA (MazF antagonist)